MMRRNFFPASLSASIASRSSLTIILNGGGAVSGVGCGCGSCAWTAGTNASPHRITKFLNQPFVFFVPFRGIASGLLLRALSQLNLTAKRWQSQFDFIDLELIGLSVGYRQEF